MSAARSRTAGYSSCSSIDPHEIRYEVDVAVPADEIETTVEAADVVLQPATLFQQLSALVYAEAEPAAIYQGLSHLAVAAVDGCDHASIMLNRRGAFITAAATDEVAQRIDEFERAVGAGPCVDAIVDEPIQLDTDIRTHTSWPRLAELVLAQTPVRGMLGYRLLVDGQKVGALNLFADKPGALSETSADQAAIVAAFASVTLIGQAAKQDAQTMQQGLHSNREIGTAVGLLMAAHKCSQDEAFELLKSTSQNLNMKLAHVARQVISGQDAQRRRNR